MLNDILFCSSVLMFAAAAILAYWQIVRAKIEAADQPEQDLEGTLAKPAQIFLADLTA